MFILLAKSVFSSYSIKVNTVDTPSKVNTVNKPSKVSTSILYK